MKKINTLIAFLALCDAVSASIIPSPAFLKMQEMIANRMINPPTHYSPTLPYENTTYNPRNMSLNGFIMTPIQTQFFIDQREYIRASDELLDQQAINELLEYLRTQAMMPLDTNMRALLED